jgi:hypothetical protein
VTIEHLNKPVPHDLLQEVNHLRALEHNTIICHGFQQGDLIAIPDPESERQVGCKKLKAKFVADDTNSACNKQPAHQDIIHPQAKALKANVSHIKQSHMPLSANTVWQGSTGSISSQISRAPSAGCTWSASDWLCTYDCVFMAYSTYTGAQVRNGRHIGHHRGTCVMNWVHCSKRLISR